MIETGFAGAANAGHNRLGRSFNVELTRVAGWGLAPDEQTAARGILTHLLSKREHVPPRKELLCSP